MDNRTIRLFLSASILALLSSGTCYAEEAPIEEPPVIEPNVVRLGLKDADIDDENFEVGAYIGFMSVENFGTFPVFGARGAWHLSEDLFFEANIGTTSVDKTPEEERNDINFFTDDERDLLYYNLSLGFNILPGEVFLTEDWAFNSSFYVIAGGGTVEFLGEKEFALNLGGGLRLILTDQFAIHLGFQDIITDKPVVLNPNGEDGSAHNMQYTFSGTYFF